MKRKNINKIARKFVKEIDGRVDFATLEKYLKVKYGYTVIFFNTVVGDREVSRFGLSEDIKHTDALAYKSIAKIIFINNECSSEEKLYLLYHEAGHIALGHMDYPRLSARNKVLLDIEADVFAHWLYSKERRA